MVIGWNPKEEKTHELVEIVSFMAPSPGSYSKGKTPHSQWVAILHIIQNQRASEGWDPRLPPPIVMMSCEGN